MITVITVVFNALEDLKLTAESVFNQTAWPDIEYIIVDGGSNDGTPEYLKSLPPSVRWLSEPDKGIYDAMNKGIRMARGKSIVMLNAGDSFPHDTLERVQRYAKSHSITLKDAVLFGDAVYVFGGDRVLRPSSAAGLLRGMSICHQAAYVGRAIYERFGLYSMKYRLAADYDLFLRIYKNDPAFFVHMSEVLAEFRYEGLSSRSYRKSYNEALQVAREHLRGMELLRYRIRHMKSLFLRYLEAIVFKFWPGRDRPDLARLLYRVRSAFRREKS